MNIDKPRGAILQRDKTTWAIVPRTPVGLVSADILESIARAVRKYNVPAVKITSGQRLALVGIEKDDVDRIWHDLKMDVGPAIELCVHYVQACPGNDFCTYGVQDSIGLGLELEKLYVGQELPAKVKMGVSGCSFCCGESYMRDVGMVGKSKGWTMIVGGNAAGRPQIGEVVADSLSREEAIALTGKFLDYYRANARKKERTARMLARVGIEAVKSAIL